MLRYEETVPFTFPITQGHVVKVYDGDTITIAAKMPYNYESPLYRFPVRLNGIDTAEIKGKTPDEKEAARIAKTELQTLLLHKDVVLKNIKNEKFGRILADVFLEDLHINQWMIEKRFAVPYDGKTKKTPDCWLKYLNNV
jgi:endonuclease YncB( thermonuclease family)